MAPANLAKNPRAFRTGSVKAIGIQQGHDPESFDILRSRSAVESEIEIGSHIHCPWRSAPCIVYPAELQWAKQWHDAGESPPIVLADRFKD